MLALKNLHLLLKKNRNFKQNSAQKSVRKLVLAVKKSNNCLEQQNRCPNFKLK
jgi:hypothetical protein